MKQIAIFHFVAAVLLTVVIGHALPITAVDQQNLGPVTGSAGGVPFGQSFVPTLPRIDAIEFLMVAENATAFVEILSGVSGVDGLSGPVIGISNAVFVDNLGQPDKIHFDFTGGVTLTPGDTYVALLFTTSGNFTPGVTGIGITVDDAYPRGQLYEAGLVSDFFPRTSYDMIFTEGLTGPIPEPATVWMISLGLGVVIALRQARQPE